MNFSVHIMYEIINRHYDKSLGGSAGFYYYVHIPTGVRDGRDATLLSINGIIQRPWERGLEPAPPTKPNRTSHIYTYIYIYI